MGNQNSRSMTYEQYYAALKQSNPHAAQTLEVGGLDAYEVLGVSKNFDWEELKLAYRRIAMLVHPDKGGSEKIFQMVTECFKRLAYEFKLRQSDRPHHELKADAQQYYQKNPMQTNRATSKDENFMDRFNRMFEEHRLEDDEHTTGYGHMMAASSKTRDDINVPKLLNSFAQDTFNKTFEQVVTPESKDVVVYKEPEALPLARKIQYTELGKDKPGDYSSGEGEKRTLQYTDYMKAHTTSRLVDPRAVQERPQYRNVEQYEAARSRVVAAPASQEELAWRAEKQRLEEQAEQDRLRRLQERDRRIAQHHDNVNRLMLGNGR
jgi:curved DNA-binding protein CbpA